jgi:deoxycytidylate deaminase
MDVIRQLNELFLIAQDVDTAGKSNTGRVAASLIYRNQVISWGINEHKSHPFQAQFRKHEEAIYWHAETRAIHNALRRVDREVLGASTLMICRARYTDDRATSWQWGLARPCAGCQRAIAKYGIPTVIHSLDRTGEYQVIKKIDI